MKIYSKYVPCTSLTSLRLRSDGVYQFGRQDRATFSSGKLLALILLGNSALLISSRLPHPHCGILPDLIPSLHLINNTQTPRCDMLDCNQTILCLLLSPSRSLSRARALTYNEGAVNEEFVLLVGLPWRCLSGSNPSPSMHECV